MHQLMVEVMAKMMRRWRTRQRRRQGSSLRTDCRWLANVPLQLWCTRWRVTRRGYVGSRCRRRDDRSWLRRLRVAGYRQSAAAATAAVAVLALTFVRTNFTLIPCHAMHLWTGEGWKCHFATYSWLRVHPCQVACKVGSGLSQRGCVERENEEHGKELFLALRTIENQ